MSYTLLKQLLFINEIVIKPEFPIVLMTLGNIQPSVVVITAQLNVDINEM